MVGRWELRCSLKMKKVNMTYEKIYVTYPTGIVALQGYKEKEGKTVEGTWSEVKSGP